MLKYIFSLIVLDAVCSWAGGNNADEKNNLLSPFQVQIVEGGKNRKAPPSWFLKIIQGAVSIEDVPEIGDIRIETREAVNTLQALIALASREEKMVELVGSALEESSQERRYLITERNCHQVLLKSETDIAFFASNNPSSCECKSSAEAYEIDPWTIVLPNAVGTRHKIGLYQQTANVPGCVKDIYLNAFQRNKFEELLGVATESGMMLKFMPQKLDVDLRNGQHIIKKPKTVADIFEVSTKKIPSQWQTYSALEFRRKFGEGVSPESMLLCCLIPEINRLGLNASGWDQANERIKKMWFYENFLVNKAYLNLPLSRRKALEIPVDLVFEFIKESTQSPYEPVSTSEKTLE